MCKNVKILKPFNSIDVFKIEINIWVPENCPCQLSKASGIESLLRTFCLVKKKTFDLQIFSRDDVTVNSKYYRKHQR